MSRKLEATLQDKFVALLKREGILYLKTQGGLSYLPNGKGGFMPINHKKGFSDIIVFYYKLDDLFRFTPRTIFIELKTDTGKLRESQFEKFNKLKQLNYECYVLKPRNWEEAKILGKLTFENVLNEMEIY